MGSWDAPGKLGHAEIPKVPEYCPSGATHQGSHSALSSHRSLWPNLSALPADVLVGCRGVARFWGQEGWTYQNAVAQRSMWQVGVDTDAGLSVPPKPGFLEHVY